MANEGIELSIFAPTDLTNPIANLPGRRNPKVLDEIGGVGGGSFFVSYSDPKVQDPAVLRARNICKVKVDGLLVNAFILSDRATTIVSSGENKDRGRQVEGRGLKSWFDDASVAPYGGIKQNSKDQRYFNFATEQGAWYVAADWTNPVIYGQINVDSRWGDRVKKWPEKAKAAKWIWAAPYADPAPQEFCYFRWTVTAASAGLFAIYATADDYFELYVDGEQLAKSNLNTSASYEASRIEVALSAGTHIIGFKARNVIAPGFNGPAALAAAFFSVADDKTETLIGQSGSGTWKSLAYPAYEPGWTAGEVMIKLLDEAQARGVLFPTYLTKTFTAAVDTNGVAWPDKIAWTFKVGESYSSVLSKIEDLYDVWINPSNNTLNMAPNRGTNRSSGTSPVQFILGRDLLEAATQAKGNIKNSLMVKSLEGWTTEEDAASIAQFGRIEDTLDTGASKSMAKKLAALVFSSRAQEEIGATYRVISAKYRANVDYFVGDWVLAPNERGQMVPRRIMSISYEESNGGIPIPTLEFDTIFQDNESKLSQAVGKLGGGGVGGGLGNVSGSTPGVGGPVELPPTTSPPTLKPKAPTGITAVSSGYWSANGVTPLSTVQLNWAAVTQYTDNSALVPEYYLVERKLTTASVGWEMVGKYYTNSATISGFTPGEAWTFRISTFDNLGTPSDTAASASHTMVAPNSVMMAPTPPTLVSDMAIIIATWDGKLVGPLDPPPQFRYVYAEMSTAATGQPWTRVGGSIQRGGGQIQITGEPKGSTRFVRFVAVDGLGIASNVSASASITVTGITGADIDAAITDAIEDAQNTADAALTAANGKNKNYYQTAKPTGGTYTVGDNWFDTDDGYKLYQYNGTDFVAAPFGNSAIATLDAGKITTGTLNADRIGANSISTQKLLIANLDNLLEDPGFEAALTVGWTSINANATRVTANMRNGAGALQIKAGSAAYDALRQKVALRVEPGEKYRYSGWVRSAAAGQVTGAIEFGVMYGATDAATTTASGAIASSPALTTTYTFVSGVWTVPAGVYYARPRLVSRADTGNTNLYLIDDLSFTRMTGTTFIEDGAITTEKLFAEAVTAEKIAAATITVNELSPSVGDELNLNANGAINVIINNQNNQASQIATAQDTANDAASAAQAAATTAGNAQSQVGTLDTKVNAVDTEQKATKDTVNNLQTWFRVDAIGAHVGQTGSIFQTHILSNQFNITENDVVTTYWESGRMVVPSLVADKMVLTNFTFEAYAGGMVVRLG